MNKVNFLGLTNKEPISSRINKIQKQWDKEDPSIFKSEAKEECSEAVALNKLNELGFKAHCQIKGEQIEIRPDFWKEGQPLEKGPKLYAGIEEGYYKLTKVAEQLEKGVDPSKVQHDLDDAIWDSSEFSFAQIQEKITEVEAKYEEVVAQKQALLQEKESRTIQDELNEIEEGFFSKEFDEIERATGFSSKQKGLQVFS